MKKHASGRCEDCRRLDAKPPEHSRPVRYVVNGEVMWCRSWNGDYDDDDNPEYQGRPYMPGPRRCGHRDCVNSSHIGDGNAPPGAQRAEEEIIDIRERFAGGASLRELAERFEVHENSVRSIVRGKSYAHVGGPTRA